MNIKEVEWDAHNRRHFAEHRPQRCTLAEVDDILLSRCFRSRFREQERQEHTDESRYVVFGQACTKKFLKVIATPRPNQRMRPITCIHPSDAALVNYLRWRQTVKR